VEDVNAVHQRCLEQGLEISREAMHAAQFNGPTFAHAILTTASRSPRSVDDLYHR
jgi:hypothetical protein